MKNILFPFWMLVVTFIPATSFSQQTSDTGYRHFIALNMAPAVGQLVDGSSSGTTIGLGYKFQLNDSHKLRLMTQFEQEPVKWNASYYAFTDTILTFRNQYSDLQNWRVSAGFEKGKFNEPLYLYWGVQAAFGMKKSAYKHDFMGSLAASDYIDLPILPGFGLAHYNFEYSEQPDTIEFTTYLKQSRIALGVPMGIGVRILKHVELHVELTTELSYETTDYTKERFQSKEISHLKTQAFELDIRQFQILLGWKF